MQLQQFGGPRDVLIRIAQQPGGDAAQQAAVQKVRAALGDAVEYRRVEVVGPRVSSELLAYGVGGLMLAIVGILIYLWFRFEWQFALGAMIANVHDIVLTIGFMSIAQIDFDLTSIAALLTILGYSLNDTVVIYDRIREMLRRYKKMPMPELLNVSVNSTLSRSVITHVTVTLALLALLLVRRPGDPQLHRDHDVRRGAGRHLHLDLHRRADPDLSRRRHQPCSTTRTSRRSRQGRDGRRAGRGAASSARGADRRLRQRRLPLRRHVAPRLAAVPAERHLGLAGRACGRRSTSRRWRWSSPRPSELDTLIIGTGTEMAPFPPALRQALRRVSIVVDAMQTGPAIRVYNIMIGERRRVAAGLIAVP